MTWSIIARDPVSGRLGVAVATYSVAVGSRCPFVRPGVGAVATQSITNRYLAVSVLDALEVTKNPRDALEQALVADEGREFRQIHVIDCAGEVAVWTGRHCVEACGHTADAGVSVAGNTLKSAAVLDAALSAWRECASLPFAERLLSALGWGGDAGGDVRGTQSAALVVIGSDSLPEIDLRIDSSAQPIAALRGLLDVWRATVESTHGLRPSEENPGGSIDFESWEAQWREEGFDLKFRR